ncbi:MAG TPA: ABC transporter substrate-binding protein [Anaerolineaceae bacterium]|nr:ABC transporter substrate-binding protein [Anaerolineaceae bacterium]
MRHTVSVFLSILVTFSFLLAGCAAQPVVRAVEQEPPTPSPENMVHLRIGVLPIGAFTPFFVAQEKGYFTEQGLAVEFETFRTGAEMIAPLSLGQIDVGGGEAGTALFNAIAQGLDLKVVLSLSTLTETNSYFLMVARKDLVDSGEIKTMADLRERKIGINNQHGMTEYFAAQALKTGDLTVDDVQLVILPFPEMVQALANKALDVAYLQHPLAATALNPGPDGQTPMAVELYSFYHINPEIQCASVLFGKNLLDPKNEDVGARLTVALLKAARDMQGDAWRSDEQIVRVISERTGVPEAVVRKSVMPGHDPDGTISWANLETMQSYYLERGYPEYTEPLPEEQVVEERFQQLAVERLGAYQP